MRSFSLALATWAFALVTVALDPIEVVGNKFFNKDGSQFFLKGIAYQLRPDDPLVDTEQCKRDVSLMKELGVNSIRVYHVDAEAKHDGCMKAFADAGIYLLIDLDTFDTYIEPENMRWNQTQYDKYAEVMNTFHDYDNVLGFFIANEKIAAKTDSPVAPYFKAATRDMKAYRDAKGYRKIPIGYSAAHIVELQPMLQDYLTCGGNSSEIVDFFALNSYSWCQDSDNMQTSGYDILQKNAQDFPVPIFFSETGCITHPPRTFADQDAVFSKPMVGTWSGAIIYEWIEESNHYGLVSYGPPASNGANDDAVEDGYTRKGTPTPISPDFDNLKKKWATITPSGVSKKDYDPSTVTTPVCPTATKWWEVDGNVKLPTLNEEYTGSYTQIPSATADPSSSSTSGAGKDKGGKNGDDKDGDDKDGSDKDGDDEDSAASSDKKIALFGSVLGATVLTVALVL